MNKQDIYNFIDRVETGCWNWTRAKDGKGYGVAYVPYRISAHRLSFEVTHGPIPAGKHVLHRCDNPACINPDHLFVGTHRDNMLDKENKGRANHVGAQGTRNGNSILTEKDVISLLRDYVSGLARKEIAAKYGIRESSVSDYTSGDAWTHLHGKHGCPTLEELSAARRISPVTEADVREVWRLHFEGKSAPEISKIVGHSVYTIDGIVLGRTWRHLPDAPTIEALRSGGVHRGFNQFSRGGDTRDLHPKTKIPSSEIPSILRRIDAGETLEAIGNTYGVKKTAIWHIKKKHAAHTD